MPGNTEEDFYRKNVFPLYEHKNPAPGVTKVKILVDLSMAIITVY